MSTPEWGDVDTDEILLVIRTLEEGDGPDNDMENHCLRIARALLQERRQTAAHSETEYVKTFRHQAARMLEHAGFEQAGVHLRTLPWSLCYVPAEEIPLTEEERRLIAILDRHHICEICGEGRAADGVLYHAKTCGHPRPPR